MSAGGPPALPRDVKLRIAVMNLACAPQAQRRYVQLGMLQQACRTVEEEAAQVDELLEAGILGTEQADLLVALGEELARLRAGSDDFLQERASWTREFLYGNALEDEGWGRVRHLARPFFTALRQKTAPV